MTDVQPHHERVLIVDYGSQVTQLIARRVREDGVFCEVHPCQKVDDAFVRRVRPRRGDPVRRPGERDARGQPPRPDAGVRAGRAGAGGLLWRAADVRPAGRGGGGRLGGIRPRGHRARARMPAVRRPGRGRPPRARVDESRRRGQRHPARLRHGRHQPGCALRRHRRRGEALLRRAIPPRGDPHAPRSADAAQLHAADRRAEGRLDHGRLPSGGGGAHTRAGRLGPGDLRPVGRGRQLRSPRS